MVKKVTKVVIQRQRPKAKKARNSPRRQSGSSKKTFGSKMPLSLPKPLSRKLANCIVDPFSGSACIPDGNRATSCFTMHEQVTLTTGGGTCYGIVVQPNPQNFIIPDSASANPTPTMPVNWNPSAAVVTLANQFRDVRPVACGIRMNYTGNTINDQGVIIVGQYSQDFTATQFTGKSLAQVAASSSWYEIVPLRQGAQVTWRPDNMEDMANWSTFTTAGGSVSTVNTLPMLYAFVYGAAVSGASTVQVEVICHMEGKIAQQSFIPGGLQTAGSGLQVAEPGWFETAYNFARNIKPYTPLVNSALNYASAFATKALMSGAANALNYPAVLGSQRRLQL